MSRDLNVPSEVPAAQNFAKLFCMSADKAIAALHGILICKAASQALHMMVWMNTAENPLMYPQPFESCIREGQSCNL